MRAPLTPLQRFRSRLDGEISWARLGVEVGVVALDVAAFAGLGRLFTSAQPMAAIIVAVLLTHGIAITCRAARIPGPIAALVSFVALAAALCTSAFPETVRLGFVPTSESAVQVRLALAEAWDRFVTVRAPTEPLLGFTIVAVAAAWMVGTVSDTIAFRLRYLTEACVPPSVVLVVSSALAPERYRPQVVLAFAAAAGLLAVSSRARDLNGQAWLGGRPRHRGAWQALALVAVGLVVATAVATRPPAWATRGLVDWRKDRHVQGPGERLATNPLVSTRSRLVDQSAVEMFRVRTDRPTYWRQTSLDRYADESWTGASVKLSPQTTTALRSIDPAQTWTQELEILGLRSAWLPVADRVLQVSDPAGAPADGVSIDGPSGAAVIADDLSTGQQFRVTSGPIDASIPGTMPAARRQQLLALPATVSPRVAQLAKEVTAGASTDLERARALDQFFTTSFVYDLDVARTGGVTLESFLFSDRRGYCEQFSGAFAVMARTLGIPSRVAVGFVPGEEQADGSMLVRGRDAHAWPELLLDGGWVAFEPTPGRGRGNATNPTTTTTAPPTEAPTTVAPPAAEPTTTAALPDDVLDPEPTATSDHRSLTSVATLLAALLALLCVPTLVRRIRLGSVPDDPAERVAAAWNLVEDDLAWLGHHRLPSEPLNRFVGELGPLPEVEGLVPLVPLAAEVEAAQFGSGGEEWATLLSTLADVHRLLAGAVAPGRRVQRVLSLRLRPRISRRG